MVKAAQNRKSIARTVHKMMLSVMRARREAERAQIFHDQEGPDRGSELGDCMEFAAENDVIESCEAVGRSTLYEETTDVSGLHCFLGDHVRVHVTDTEVIPINEDLHDLHVAHACALIPR